MEDYKNIYLKSNKIQRKLSEEFLNENMKLLLETIALSDIYGSSFGVSVPGINQKDFFNLKSYKAIKETCDNSIFCTEYLENKIKNCSSIYEIIKIYKLLKKIYKIEKESLSIYQKFIQDYLIILEETMNQFIISLLENGNNQPCLSEFTKTIKLNDKIFFNVEESKKIKEKIMKI